MEPLFFKAENKQRVVIIADNDTLQWSRFFSKRKIPQTVMPLSGKVASMEPLFFKAENLARSDRICAPASRGFNGAAFFQSGKCPSPPVGRIFSVRFNGAAFFQSGK